MTDTLTADETTVARLTHCQYCRLARG